MILQQIEVRAREERYDVQAHRLAREILQLPIKYLPTLAANTANDTLLSIRTAHLYRLSGNLTSATIDQLTRELLVDPVVQEARMTQEPVADYVVDVFFHPGVTDTLAESVLAGTQMLGIPGLERVETGRRYVLDERLSEAEVHTIARALLYNPVIQRYELQPRPPQPHREPLPNEVVNFDWKNFVRISITGMRDEQLLDLSRTGLLALNLDEMRVIQQLYREQGREPTDVELETLAQTWSEHCSHKTFKATIEYREEDSNGNVLESETIPGLLRHYIMRATEQIKPPWLVSAFSDNAGIIRFTDMHDLAFKVETHNHPSAIEPFGGANTGVGGVIRDVLGVSARPIACTDILCFGPPNTSTEELPAGVLPSRRIASGVVDGVRDYGNKMGIPTVNGAILYHEGYIYNPLVFCGCLGVLPHGSHPNAVKPGDLIVVLGGRTGRDGVHGATFSSGEMSSEINARAGAAVQIGAPITEKKVADVVLQAREHELYNAITDCGAGGFSSAIGEMGASTGAHVELAKAPLKYQGLAPWEIWVSEAQERMVLAVPPAKLEELQEICAIEEIEISIIGAFTGDHRLTLTYQGQRVADIDMDFLHSGRPGRRLEAVWKTQKVCGYDGPLYAGVSDTTHYTPALLALLRHPTIASKEAVVRRYDHEVQGATVLKPLVGRAGNGPGDAAVLQPLLDTPGSIAVGVEHGRDKYGPSAWDEKQRAGIVISNGVNPLYGTIDPYAMALNAVDEALRNLTAVGGDITRAALLDNFCWGNPTDPVQLGMLVRAVKGCHDAAVGFSTPFISGKDSLNNEYRAGEHRVPVLPTLVISAVGVIEDAAQTIDMSLETPGNLLYLIGKTGYELGGSHYAEVVDRGTLERFIPYAAVPHVDIASAATTMKTLGAAIRKGLVRSCHDLSEGGLAVAAAEMSLASMLGMTLDIGRIVVQKKFPAVNIARLFSESASRFLVEIAPEQWGAFEKHMRTAGVEAITYLGTVAKTPDLIIRDGDIELIHVSVAELQEAWKGGQA